MKSTRMRYAALTAMALSIAASVIPEPVRRQTWAAPRIWNESNLNKPPKHSRGGGKKKGPRK